MAKVSTSGQEAVSHNFLGDKDGISVNGDHLLYDAKQKALALYEAGYKAPIRKRYQLLGKQDMRLLRGAEAMHLSGYISEYDLHIAKKLAYVIAGGKVPYGTEVDEQYLLDVEREAFISLVSEMKSQARMRHMLVKESHYVTNNEGDIVHERSCHCCGSKNTNWKGKEGFIKTVRPDDLGALVVKETLKRANYEGPIDDLIFGCAMPEAEQGLNMARNIGGLAGLSYDVPAITINRYCSSGLQSIGLRSRRIMLGHSESVLSGGAESMSLVPMMGHVVRRIVAL